MQITIRDQTLAGRIEQGWALDVLSETVTVRELIRGRVYQEVDDHNRRVRAAAPDQSAIPFNGLVTPTPEERALNVRRSSKSREIDWQKQFDAACDAFERNGFFVLLDDVQPDGLDDVLTLTPQTTVSFVKLTPLVGG